MKLQKENTTKKRRTKKELEEIIWNAFERLVIREGFNGITLIKLAREAGVEPPVIYNRFENEDDLFEQFFRKKDFWLNNAVNISPDLSPKENLTIIFTNLVDSLYDNEMMQRVLLWMLNDTHKTTRQLAMQREFENSFLIDYYNNAFKNCGVNTNVVVAVLLGGTYYLIMHKKISPVSTVNFNSENGKEELKKTMRDMINTIF